jgi:hypothetical protein
MTSLRFQVAKSELEKATVQLKLVQQEKVATRQVRSPAALTLYDL